MIRSFALLFLSLFTFIYSSQGAENALSNPATDGGVESALTIFKTLSQDDVLRLTIETDLDHLIENKYRNDYQEAKLTVNGIDSSIEHRVKIKPRGKFRRKTCDFPPLKIKFGKSELEDKGLSTAHKSLKLVTHCMEDEDAEQRIIKEYLAYKIYNQLTEASYKVQLVEITYINSVKDSIADVKYGFLIENTDEMAERINGEEIENCYNITLDSINKRYSHIIPMFQYMISNMDWRPQMLQNVKVVDKENGDRIMIPYDFDFSGLVDAPYARPSADFQQSDVRERIYMHKVADLNELEPTIRYFKSHKKEIFHIIKSCEHLSKKNRRKMVNYINGFYQTLESPLLCEIAFVK